MPYLIFDTEISLSLIVVQRVSSINEQTRHQSMDASFLTKNHQSKDSINNSAFRNTHKKHHAWRRYLNTKSDQDYKEYSSAPKTPVMNTRKQVKNLTERS